MRKVDLRMNELQKYEIIKKVAHGKTSKNRAAVTIGVTKRTINRLLVKYNTFGKEGFVHGNRNKKPSTSKIDTIKNEIVTLYDLKYEGFNFKHFHEKLIEDEGYEVSETSVRNWLKQEGFISPKANRITKKEYKKKQIVKELPELDNNPEIDEILEIQLADSHPTRERKKYMGELIQLDASDHLWFGDTKTHLHAAIDDASGKIVGLYFDKQETLNGYYNVYKQILRDYGIPYEFLTDKRTVFEYKRKNASSIDKDTFTQFSYACKRLGTHITTSSIPQAKGRVERLFNTLQSRLISELRLENITTIDEANRFLESFKMKFNLKFALPIKDTKNVYESVNNLKEIDTILSVISPRVINKGSCISYNNNKYYPELEGERRYFPNRTKVLVVKSLSGKLYCSIGEKMYLLIKLNESSEFSIEFDMPSVIQKKKNKYIPPMSHPWKHESFKKFVEKQKHLNSQKVASMFD